MRFWWSLSFFPVVGNVEAALAGRRVGFWFVIGGDFYGGWFVHSSFLTLRRP